MISKQSKDKLMRRGVRLGVGGFAGGAGVAAVLNLLHELEIEKTRRAMRREKKRTDEGTIVLNIPKAASVEGGKDDPVSIKHVERPSTSNKRVPVKSYRAGNYGSHTMKVAKSDAPWPFNKGWMQWALGTGAIGVGGLAGYKVVDALYQTRLKRQLQREENEAREDMMNVLQNSAVKTGGWLDDIIDVEKVAIMTGEANTKEAQSRMDVLLGVPTLLTLMGGAGVAYLTKRLLDAQREAEGTDKIEAPKVQRIVFRATPDKDKDGTVKEAQYYEPGVVQAAVIVHMEKMGSERRVLDLPEMQPIFKRAGITADGLIKAADHTTEMLDTFQKNPEVWKALKDWGIQQYPGMRTFGWGDYKYEIPAKHVSRFANLPGVRQLSDRAMRQYADKVLRGGDAGTFDYSRFGKGLARDAKQQVGNAWGYARQQGANLYNKYVSGSKGANPFPGLKDFQLRSKGANPFPGLKDFQYAPEMKGFFTGMVEPFKNFMMNKKEGADKSAMLSSAMITNMLGKQIVNNLKAKREAGKAEVAETREAPAAPQIAEKSRISEGIKLEAEDPAAAKYLEENRERLRALLDQLISEDKT